MTRIDPKRPMISYTMVWQRNDEGEWDRFLVREQPNSPPHMSRLTRVKANVPVCMACLSTNVAIVASERFADGELYCKECGVQYGFVL